MSLRRIGPGCYVRDEVDMELDIPEMLAWLHIEDTPANRDLCVAVCQQIIRKRWPGVRQTVVKREGRA